MKTREQFGRQSGAAAEYSARRRQPEEISHPAQHQEVCERRGDKSGECGSVRQVPGAADACAPRIETAPHGPASIIIWASTAEASISHCRGVNIRNSGPT